MVLTLDRATPRPDPTPGPATPQPWHCPHCGTYLGRWRNGVLHEPNGSKSGLPVVRRCKCGKRNVRLAS